MGRRRSAPVRHHAAVGDRALAALRAFRAAVYACFGRRRAALGDLLDALVVLQQIGELRDAATALRCLAESCLEDDPARAVRLLGAARSVFPSPGSVGHAQCDVRDHKADRRRGVAVGPAPPHSSS